MRSDDLTPRPIPAETAKPAAAEGSYVDWAAILAGAVFALAISFLLLSFGATLGLSLSSPYRGEGMSAAWLAIAAGIWFAWVTVSAFGAGGYLSGRLRRRSGDAKPDEVEVRDGAHGLMVWATAMLVSTALAASGVGGLVSAGTSAAGSVAETATEVAGDAASSEYFANLMLRNGVRQPATGAPDGDRTPAPDADRSPTPGQQPAQQTTDVAGIDPAVQQEIAGIVARSAAGGEMVERDRTYLAQLVAANTGLDAEEARARVDEVNAEIDEARAAALAAVERARVTGVVFGFIAAATLLIGAAAAYFAAAAGGRHRDDGLGLDVVIARR